SLQPQVLHTEPTTRASTASAAVMVGPTPDLRILEAAQATHHASCHWCDALPTLLSHVCNPRQDLFRQGSLLPLQRTDPPVQTEHLAQDKYPGWAASRRSSG